MRELSTSRWRILLVLVVGVSVVSFGAMTGAGSERDDEDPTRPAPSATGSHLDAPTVTRSLTTTGTVRRSSTGGSTSTSPDPSPSPDLAPATELSRAPAAEPNRTSTNAPMDASVPVRLRVATLGVDTPLMDLGLQVDGTLEVPPDGSSAGWYIGAPTPGALGPAVIAGHVDWDGRPGVFSDLHELRAGDEIEVTRRDGSTAWFHVTHVVRSPKDSFPTEAVYGDTDHAGLRLITCGGEFDRGVRSYRDNVVVFAELVGSDTGPPASS